MPLKSPEAVLRSALVGNAGFLALAGSRVYPLLAPKTAALPFVAYRRSGIERTQTIGGPVGTPRVRVEFGVYATTYEAARDVADAMRKVLDGYKGTVDNTEVKYVALDDESDDFVQLAGADLPAVYQVTQTYTVLWQET